MVTMNSNLITLCLLAFVISIKGERLHQQIYSTIDGAAACFRRLNGTHQVGCSSSSSGTVGIIQIVNNVDDAKWIVFNSTAGTYMAVVSTSVFNSVIELFMEYPTNVAGILIYENKNETTTFSQETRCPNEYSSDPESQCKSSTAGGITWNELGSGLLRRDIPFPMFFLPESHIKEIEKIKSCFERFNLDKDNQARKPLCSLQLTSFMFAAVNTDLCLKRSASSSLITPRKMCDALSDNNVYSSLFPRTKAKTEANSVTLVTARIDSASLFDGLSPGGATSVVGLVSLLTAAATLSKMLPMSEASKYKKNVIWTLFNGEAFDYIGSQRVAYDIKAGRFPPNAPLATSQIKLHLDIGQLGGSLKNSQSSWNLSAFIPYKEWPQQITEFLSYLNHNIPISSEFTMNLPPSSLHSFRRILANVTKSGDLPELLLVDHKETFTNKFYQSVLDNAQNIGFKYHNISIDSSGTFLDTDALIADKIMSENDVQVKVARLATAIAKALYNQVAEEPYSGDIKGSAHLVDEMLYCFMTNQACKLLLASDYDNTAYNPDKLPQQPPPLYVGVVAWANTAPVFVGHLLALLTGEEISVNQTSCSALRNVDFNHYWLRGWNHSGVCIRTTMNFTDAISPAFMEEGYDFSSGVYSSWTESVWQSMSARIFVSPGGGGAVAALATGGFTTLLSIFVTYWLKKYSHIIFATAPPSNIVTINNDASAGILRTVNC